MDAIIFLAPISGFDQVLAEDKTVNRLVSYPIILTVAYVFISLILAIIIRKTPYYYGKPFVQINCSQMWI